MTLRIAALVGLLALLGLACGAETADSGAAKASSVSTEEFGPGTYVVHVEGMT